MILITIHNFLGSEVGKIIVSNFRNGPKILFLANLLNHIPYGHVLRSFLETVLKGNGC